MGDPSYIHLFEVQISRTYSKKKSSVASAGASIWVVMGAIMVVHRVMSLEKGWSRYLSIASTTKLNEITTKTYMRVVSGAVVSLTCTLGGCLNMRPSRMAVGDVGMNFLMSTFRKFRQATRLRTVTRIC